MELFTVHFTLARIITHYDSAGCATGTETMDVPHTVHALPLLTAMQYSNCKNFRKEPYRIDQDNRRVAVDARQFGKTAAARFETGGYKKLGLRKDETAAVIKEAAASGDMSAAINRATSNGAE